MALKQSIEGCLERSIGSGGLSEAGLKDMLARIAPAMDRLRKQYEDGSLPILRNPEWTDDIADARRAMERLSAGAETIVFYGTGGSSLGGQTLTQLSGWFIPGDMGNGKPPVPRVRFYDNVDGRTLGKSLDTMDLAKTRFVVISKSGSTAETLAQMLSAMQAVRDAGLAKRIPELFLAVTEPPKEGAFNGLRTLCDQEKIPMLEHHTGVGGRFSALTNVGLLPAIARKLDVEALRRGAAEVVQGLLSEPVEEFAPAIGAAVAIGLSKEKDIRAQVMLAYSDRLARFTHWYVQLWAESLGKNGEGTTPVAALGPVDQHSQLQLWLDGPPQHMVTVLRTDCAGVGPIIEPEWAKVAGADYLAGFTAGDLVAAQQQAIPDALTEAGRPVRIIDLGTLDEETLGGLMMHFMLETVLAAEPLGVDPFDQPAVESGKVLTRRYLADKAKETKGARSPASADAR